MNFSTIPIIATAIAIIISWALFAILCSMINEAIAQVKAERGKFMKKYLLQQLQDLPNGVNWASLLYQHGSVDMLSRSPDKPTNTIPSKVFAETLVDIVAQAHIVQIHLNDVQLPQVYKNKLLNDFKTGLDVLNPSDAVIFFKQALTNAEIKAGIKLNEVESEVYTTLVQNIQSWYDEFTNRISYWYKKKTRQRLLWMGFILGVALNIDSIQLFNYFSKEPNARAAIINYYQQNATTLSNMANQLQAKDSTVNVQQDTTAILKLTANYIMQMDSLKKQAELPIGWSHITTLKTDPNNISDKLYINIILKFLGCMLTGFAASFGAPFWFDVLKKIYSKN